MKVINTSGDDFGCICLPLMFISAVMMSSFGSLTIPFIPEY